MSKKPYRYDGKFEYLEMINQPDWNDPDVNPYDLAEYSELQKPYYYGEEGPLEYVGWEWGWPPIDPIDIPPIVVPDPVENPCEVDASCTFAKVLGPSKIDCGECSGFTQVHVWLNCPGELPYWAAFGDWFLEADAGGKCQMIPGLVIATVCCDDDAEGTVKVCWQGAGGECKDCASMNVECDVCCEEWEHTGLTTTTQGASFNHYLSPYCPDAVVTVSGDAAEDVTATLSGDGGSIAIDVGASACGAFSIDVEYTKDGCDTISSSRGVRITDSGGWDLTTNVTCTSTCTVDPAPPTGWCGNMGVNHCIIETKCYMQLTYNDWPCTGGSCTTPCGYQRTCTPNPCCFRDTEQVDWTCDGTFTDCGLL